MVNKNIEIAKRFLSLYSVKNQTELSKRLNVTPSMITQWKKGVRPIPRDRLIRAYRENKDIITLEWILGADLEDGKSPTKFRDDIAGLARDAVTVAIDWWKSWRHIHPSWPELIIPEGTEIDVEQIERMSFDDQMITLETAALSIREMQSQLPNQELKSVDSIAPWLVLENYENSILRYRQMLMMLHLEERLRGLETLINKDNGKVEEE